MPTVEGLLLGEATRTLDDRYRLSLPGELVRGLIEGDADSGACLLAKERPGCLSLWNLARWQKQLECGMALVHSKLQAGKLDGRVSEVQQLGRLILNRGHQRGMGMA